MTQSIFFYPALIYFALKAILIVGVAYARVVFYFLDKKRPAKQIVHEPKPVRPALQKGWYDMLLEQQSRTAVSTCSNVL